MELIIKGDSRRIKILEKELRLRAKKNGLEMSLKDVKEVKEVKKVDKKEPSKNSNKNKQK